MYKPTHLSLFVLGRNNGPVASVPFYAEVISPTPVQEVPIEIDDRFGEFILSPLHSLDPIVYTDQVAKERIIKAIQEAISRLLSSGARDRLRSDLNMLKKLIEKIITGVQDAHSSSLKNLSASDLLQSVEKEIRKNAERFGLEIILIPGRNEPIKTTYPLGTLATDHAGYLSFDLKRLPSHVYRSLIEAVNHRQQDANAILNTSVWFYALGREDLRFDALVQGRFAEDVILTKLELDLPLPLPQVVRSVGFLSMQNPSLTDWRLSPSSFAANPTALLGENDGCESLLPANVALHEYQFYQVISLIDDADDDFTAQLTKDVRLGVMHEFRHNWYPLGHSLGQILYSLPLAPGESINLAVIDWTRRDDAQRKERTTVDEQIVHHEHRDRIISETVNAAIHELQKGSSFMGGIASSAGISFASGVAAGLANSLGGSTARSSGTRDIASNTMQSINDNIAQTSTAKRELQSTVVIQSNQAENEAIETRTIVNYNHSHALTILYYEILRHFRIATSFVSRRPALLVKMKMDWFEGNEAEMNVREHRASLQAALLDSSLGDAFDALERIENQRQVESVNNKPSTTEPPPTVELKAAGPALRFFEFKMKTGGIVDESKNKGIEIHATLWPKNLKLNEGQPINPPGLFTFKHADNSFTGVLPSGAQNGTIQWGDIDLIELTVIIKNESGGIDIAFEHITVTGIDTEGNQLPLVDQGYEGGHLTLGNTATLRFPTKRPPTPPPPPAPPIGEVEDKVKKAKLLEHLIYHKAYYSRAILFGQDPIDRANYLAGIKLSDGTSAAEHIENRPIEIIGEYVAYPCNDPKLNASVNKQLEKIPLDEISPNERLVTLPTRGVFAEAKLGHCNASEEIDNTRFWDWQQSPIPHLAPEIAPIQGVKPENQQQNLQSTPFPQPLINIVNPAAAPDPTGLASAMNVLGTPNIFRDMSGRQEVADLLQKLADKSIKITEAANKAREIQTKYMNKQDQQQKDYDLGIYKAAAEVEGKKVEAEAQRAAQAQAAKVEADAQIAEANAMKAKAEAAKSQSEAATYLPKQSKEIRENAAQQMKDNSTKVKVIVFKTTGYDSQYIPGLFDLYVHDVRSDIDVIKVEKVVGGYYQKEVKFSTPEPRLDARVIRHEYTKLVEWDISLPPINIVTHGKTYKVEKSHTVINLNLTQRTADVSFKAKTTNDAVDELMKKLGVEAGIDKTAALKMIHSYETRQEIVHKNEEEKSYTLKVPTNQYELVFESS